MQPRTPPPARRRGVAVFAAPGGGQRGGHARPSTAPTLTLTGDATADNITLGVNAAGLHHAQLRRGRRPREQHRLRPGAGADDAAVQRHDHRRSSTPAAATTTINLSAAEPRRPPTINGERRRRHHRRLATPSTTINGGDGNDRITGFRGNETINGDNGNDVMIWNNGDGNDINDGGAGVDETLITDGHRRRQHDRHAERRAVRASTAPTRPFTVDMDDVEKLSITSFSGNDTLTTDAGRRRCR